MSTAAASPAGTASFTGELHQAKDGKATGLVVPPAVIEQLGQGKKPPVRVTFNGYTYRTTVGVMGGRAMIPVSAAVRNAAGVAAGDTLDVALVVDATPRLVSIPDDLAAAFAAKPKAGAFFATLSNSVQRMHIDNINGAKAADTRDRRVAKCVELFLAKQPR